MGIVSGLGTSRSGPTRRLFLAFAILLASACATVLTCRVLEAISHFPYLWPATGIVLGLLLPYWSDRRTRVWGIAAGTLGVFLGGLGSGLSPWFALVVAPLSLIDIIVVGSVVSTGVSGFEDLKQRRNLQRLVLGFTAGPALSACIAVAPIWWFTHDRPLHLLVAVFLADALGLAVVLPLLLFLGTGEYCSLHKLAPHMHRAGSAALLFTVALCAIFWQTHLPLLFAAFPPMVLVLVSTGLEGGVLIATLSAGIGFVATTFGHGPLNIVTGGEFDRMLVLQLFVLLISATALPLGALWDERQRAERKVAEAANVYQALLHHAEDMIILSSMDGTQRYASPSCHKLLGFTQEEFTAFDRLATIHPDDHAIVGMVLDSMASGKVHHSLRCRLVHKTEGWRWVEFSATAYHNDATGQVAGYVGIARDVTAVQITERERDNFARERENFLQEARTDALTGLPNRRAFDEALDRQLFASLGSGQDATLLLVDVDYFKKYNDTHGHQRGDQCLCQIAATLNTALSREADFIARWGGEEFVILLPGTNERGALTVAHTLLKAIRNLQLSHPLSPNGVVTISIGIAELDDDIVADPRTWVQKADIALYESKRSGRNQARIHVPSQSRSATPAHPNLVPFPETQPTNIASA